MQTIKPQRVHSEVSQLANAKFRPLNDFPQFPKLPQELRLKIWEMATDEPRVVVISSHFKDPARSWVTPPGQVRGGFYSPTPIPAALHVCAESRDIALKKYILGFSGRNRRWLSDCPARIWFNFETDWVYFSGQFGHHTQYTHFQSSILREELEKIRFIGFDFDAVREYDRYPTFSLRHWMGTGLKALETFYICLQKPRLDLEQILSYYPLPSGTESYFVKQYRCRLGGNGRFKGLAVQDAVKLIKEEFRLKEGWEEGDGREVCLSKIVKA